MADLTGGGVTAAPLPVPRPAPAPTSSPSGIRSPRIIMQERAAREARKKAEEEEQQRLEQQQMAEESRILEAARRRNAERRSGAAVSQEAAAHTRQQSLEQAPPITTHRIPTTQSNPNTTTAAASQRAAQNPAQQQTPSQAYLGQGNAAQRRSQERPSAATAAPPPDPVKPRNSFPHAFERWETLSAHWEGLTSYWIRKLEQNKDEVNREPMNQQLARQVTDLSAAGANLFHAVVELQRLRASSERKFQRWFFETRTELEQAQEVKAVLEAALQKEKRDRDSAVREAVDNDQGSSKMQKQMAEMRKELAISKEEARRAWEELGRREQEERDRTLSLQSGQPTLVGGVQVVPMTHSGHARQSSSRDHGASYEPDYTYGQARDGRDARDHDQERSTTPTGHRTPENRGYSSQHRQTDDGVSPPSATATSDGHYGEVSFIRDNQGNYLLDNLGNRIPYHTATSSHSGSDRQEHETPATTNPPSGSREAAAASSPRAQWTVPTSSFNAAAGPSGTNKPSAPQQQPSHQQPSHQQPAQKQQPPQQQQPEQQQVDADTDYSGEGYGEEGWETRHHHPTRLSDVMEEDERSRTSASHRGA